MANENEKKPRDKGVGEYAKDFVGGLFGRDDDDQQSQQTQSNQPQGEERPRDKGVVEYTRDFIGGLVGQDDDDDDQKQSSPRQKEKDQSLAGRLSDQAGSAMNTAREQARQKPQSQDSIADRMQDAVQEAAERARKEQGSQHSTQSHSSSSSSNAPSGGKSTNNAEESELERLRSRVGELEQQLGNSGQQRRTYTVAAGDSLSKIAKRYYGDPMQWKRIYEANRTMIDNPDLIYPGQVFEIPE